ncbi:hypothetical protein M422DRAFT_244883 [Sphaerobolus stellatus SS14]|nr:hypothetical protein M422DRAFT_244883 [Sphaerobolus stellatus SS14]
MSSSPNSAPKYAHLAEPDPEWLTVADQIPVNSNDLAAAIDIENVREQVSKLRISVAMARVEIINTILSLEEGEIPIRAYISESEPATTHPVVFWFQGGVFWLGSIDTDDLFLRYLCGELNLVVVAVQYRKAPEHPFPTGLSDSFASFKWVVANAEEFHGDISKGLVVAGISLGGNLATVIAQRYARLLNDTP